MVKRVNKKAISAVVATTLILMITVVAIGIIWFTVLPVIKDNLGVGDICSGVDISIDSSQGYTCYVPENITLIQVDKGNSNVNVTGLRFYLSSTGNAIKYTKFLSLFPMGSQVFYLNSSTIFQLDKIEVAPIVKLGNSEKECPTVSLEPVTVCSSSLLGSDEINQIIHSGGGSGGLINQDSAGGSPSCVANNSCAVDLCSNLNCTDSCGNNYIGIKLPECSCSANTFIGLNCSSSNGCGDVCLGNRIRDGTINSPFAITNCLELQNISANLSANYILLNDIDCTDTKNWNSGAGFIPIGSSSSSFSGNFNGGNFNISSLVINLPSTNYVGLFGYVVGNISNTRLINANVTGANYTGGLVGNQINGVEIINNSYFSGNVTGGTFYTGGLAGWVGGTINNSHSAGNVSGSKFTGGLVGNQNAGIIFNCYSTESTTGLDNVGGLAGQSRGQINNSYSTGNVTGSTYVGGFVGKQAAGYIYHSYSVGRVTNTTFTFIGGFAGSSSQTFNWIISSYWDNETSEKSSSAGFAFGKKTSDMKDSVTYSTWNWNIWAIDSAKNNGYPYLKWQNL